MRFEISIFNVRRVNLQGIVNVYNFAVEILELTQFRFIGASKNFQSNRNVIFDIPTTR